jgi:hypothetical protein
MMVKNARALMAAVAVLGLAFTDAAPIAAQTAGNRQSVGRPRAAQYRAPARVRRLRPRIVVTPGTQIRRECVADYQVVYRPYWGGNVVVPGMRCEWVRE